ncbi:MAG: hypothetical protein WCI05_05695 [Myxococcales bacterium]
MAVRPRLHALVTGMYAWGVTVAPVAWGTGAGVVAKGAALLGLAVLVLSLWLDRGRIPLLVWGFTLSSAVVWATAPGWGGRFEAWCGVAGMAGGGLFAYAAAGPVLGGPVLEGEGTRGEGTRGEKRGGEGTRGEGRGGRGVWVLAGVVGGGVVQAFGWEAVSAERGVLTRIVALAAGLGLVVAGADVAVACQEPRRSGRLRRGVAWLVLAVFLWLGVIALVAGVRVGV